MTESYVVKDLKRRVCIFKNTELEIKQRKEKDQQEQQLLVEQKRIEKLRGQARKFVTESLPEMQKGADAGKESYKIFLDHSTNTEYENLTEYQKLLFDELRALGLHPRITSDYDKDNSHNSYSSSIVLFW